MEKFGIRSIKHRHGRTSLLIYLQITKDGIFQQVQDIRNATRKRVSLIQCDLAPVVTSGIHRQLFYNHTDVRFVVTSNIPAAFLTQM